jgi:hypothetical protein
LIVGNLNISYFRRLRRHSEWYNHCALKLCLQVNQEVSGALDRLHYERGPCVRFDGDRKLWVYIHTKREEEEVEDDGTSSTIRWKKPKKDNAEN